MALIFIGIGIGVYRVVEDNIMQSLDATLMTSAKNIRDENITAKRSPFKGSRYWESLFDDFFGNQKGQIKAYAQLIDTSGAVHAKTRNIRVRLPVSRHALSRADQGQESYETFILPSGLVLRQLSLPVMKRDRFTGHLIQVASSMTETNQTLKSVKRMLWITLSIGLIISVMFGYQLTRWSLRPVTQVTTAVASLGINNDFDKRLKLPPAQDEMRELMKTFNEMIDRLEDAFMRLRRFSGDVSHELRTPIAVMRGEAELALRRERSPGEYQESLRTVVKEAENMSAIVEDLLLLARAQGKSITLQSETVHVEGFLTSLVESIKPELDRKEIDLKIVNEGKETLEMSPGYFSLALKNLLLNACKHSPQGGVVEIKVSSTYGDTRFDVIDHGEGIPPESLPYIFDTFFRADTARNRGSGGVGIGLSLAKALVSLHGGNLTVESTLGEGARFRATIPHGDKFDGFAVSKKKKAIEMVPSARPTMST
ncbi:ATP-binding protein [Pseudobacteriovorax antillogorgiicola]|nr:ATP-binding protein [Pseudobacteriovorax antillogorgiicola]